MTDFLEILSWITWPDWGDISFIFCVLTITVNFMLWHLWFVPQQVSVQLTRDVKTLGGGELERARRDQHGPQTPTPTPTTTTAAPTTIWVIMGQVVLRTQHPWVGVWSLGQVEWIGLEECWDPGIRKGNEVWVGGGECGDGGSGSASDPDKCQPRFSAQSSFGFSFSSFPFNFMVCLAENGTIKHTQ